MDESVIDHLFGKSILDKYNLKCWWEEAHDIIVKMNVIFVILLGLSFSEENRHLVCLPKSENSATSFSEAEAHYVAARCSLYVSTNYFTFIDPTYLQFVVVFISWTPFANSRFWFNSRSFRNTVVVYAEAKKRFKELKNSNSSDEIIKAVFKAGNPATQLTCKKNPFVAKTHAIVKFLWQCEPHCLSRNIFREFVICLSLSCCMALSLIFFFLQIIDHPKLGLLNEYFCELPDDPIAYNCTRPSSNHDWRILNVYAALTTLHFAIRVSGFIKVIAICCKSWSGLKTVTRSATSFSASNEYGLGPRIPQNARSSRSSILYLNWLAKECRVSDDQDFIKFIDIVFSKKFVYFMYRFRKEDRDDEALSEIATLILGDKHRLTDEEMDRLIEERDWKTIFGLLNARKQSRFRKFIEQGLNTVKKKICCCNGPRNIFTDRVCQARDKDGRSLLYYALHKESGQLDFNTRAAEILLSSTRFRKVYFRERSNDKEMDAEEFVETEYKDDISYPIPLKQELTALIKKLQPVLCTDVQTPAESYDSVQSSVAINMETATQYSSLPLLVPFTAAHSIYGSFGKTTSDPGPSSV